MSAKFQSCPVTRDTDLRLVYTLLPRLIGRSSKITDHRLWLDELGPTETEVVDFLKNVQFIDDGLDPTELPWAVLELPAGSDTHALICNTAGQLEKLGAHVRVEDVKTGEKGTI